MDRPAGERVSRLGHAQLSETAEPVDVATGLNGGDVPGSGGASEAGGQRRSTAEGDSSDTVARAGAGVASCSACGAVGTALV